MSNKVKLDLKKSKLKYYEKRNGNVKITIKFNKEESEALKQFTEVVKPENLDTDTFYKQIMIMGWKTLEQGLLESIDRAKASLEKQKEQALAAETIVNDTPKDTV